MSLSIIVIVRSSVLQIPGESTLKRNFHQIQVGEGRQTPNPFFQHPVHPLGIYQHYDESGGHLGTSEEEEEEEPGDHVTGDDAQWKQSPLEAATFQPEPAPHRPRHDVIRGAAPQAESPPQAVDARHHNHRLLPPAEVVQKPQPHQGKLICEAFIITPSNV